jgi:hypothetical protein
MDGAWLVRMRWRRRGAWLWPTFVLITFADVVIGHELPPTGDSQTLFAAGLTGLMLNLIAVVVFSWPLGLLVRRARPDMPRVVARDYGGTTAVLAVAAVLLAVGLLNHSSVLADKRALDDAVTRAQAFIGDRAPDEFRRDLDVVSTFTIQNGSVYRVCVPAAGDGQRTYCVIVNTHRPFAKSVSFAGYEPNAVLAEGVQ